MLPSIQEIENRILDDVRQHTGLQYRHVEGIDTSEESVARAVLPVLAEWVPVMSEPRMRAAIYTRFHSKHASPFLSVLVGWARKEEYPVAIEVLNYAIGTAVDVTHAEWLWNVAPQLTRSPNYYYLMAKLATFPSTAPRAKDWLADELKSGKLRYAELLRISEVEDPRITSWFSDKGNDPDKRIAALARRVINRSKKLPKGFVISTSYPDRAKEVYSTEVDSDQLELTLKDLSKRFDLKIPAPILKGHFVSRLRLDNWVVTEVVSTSSEPKQLWFRLEDVTTIEVVLITGKQAPEVIQ